MANGDGLNYGVGSLRAQAIDSLAGKILRIVTKATYPHDHDGLKASSDLYFYLSAVFTALWPMPRLAAANTRGQ